MKQQYTLPTYILFVLLVIPLTMAGHSGIGSHGTLETVILVGFVGGLAASIIHRLLRG